MRKKISCWILLCIFSLSMLTGCSEKDIIDTMSAISDVANKLEAFINETAPKNNKQRNNIIVHYIDVGQGDSEFIELPNGQTMLIDAGPQSASDTVVNYISDLGYDRIDHVTATHPHDDHIGGMKKVLDNFDIGTFYMPKKEHSTPTFTNMLKALKKNGCKSEYAKSGKTIIDEDDLKVFMLAPINNDYESPNNYSAVIKIEYKESSFLFMGDAEKSVEKEILDKYADRVKSDILKIGHHGSSTSSSQAFIKKVKPFYAVMSLEKGNRYGHPHRETLKLLKDKKIPYYRTDKHGTVIISSDGNEYYIETEK